jgi:ribosomal protein L16/L10AE
MKTPESLFRLNSKEMETGHGKGKNEEAYIKVHSQQTVCHIWGINEGQYGSH